MNSKSMRKDSNLEKVYHQAGADLINLMKGIPKEAQSKGLNI